MRKPNVWVTPRKDGNWNVRREGSKKPSHVVSTQREADEIARQIAKNNKVDRITQGRNGKIRSHDSYGNDPESTKDTEH